MFQMFTTNFVQGFSPWRRVHAAAVLWRNKKCKQFHNQPLECKQFHNQLLECKQFHNQLLECKHSNSVPKALTDSTARM